MVKINGPVLRYHLYLLAPLLLLIALCPYGGVAAGDGLGRLTYLSVTS